MRSLMGTFAHSACASRARATASFTSFASITGTRPISTPLFGDWMTISSGVGSTAVLMRPPKKSVYTGGREAPEDGERVADPVDHELHGGCGEDQSHHAVQDVHPGFSERAL